MIVCVCNAKNSQTVRETLTGAPHIGTPAAAHRAMGCKPKKIGTASQRGWGGIRERQPEDEDATPDGTDGTDANPENPYERNTELDFSRMTSVLTCPVREDGEPGCFDDLLDPSGGYAS